MVISPPLSPPFLPLGSSSKLLNISLDSNPTATAILPTSINGKKRTNDGVDIDVENIAGGVTGKGMGVGVDMSESPTISLPLKKNLQAVVEKREEMNTTTAFHKSAQMVETTNDSECLDPSSESSIIIDSRVVISPSQMIQARALLSAAFEEAMLSSSHVVDVAISSFRERFYQQNAISQPQNTPTEDTGENLPSYSPLSPLPVGCSLGTLICALSEKYPADVGVLCPFFLNYFSLSPFESIFLGPGVPHAYLSGQCIEAMACSDNVVRAGLTPKFRDIPTLCAMLSYDMTPPAVSMGVLMGTKSQEKIDIEESKESSEGDKLKGGEKSKRTRIYAPPVEFPEFMVISTVFSAQDILSSQQQPPTATALIEECLPSLESSSVLFSVSGDAVITLHNSEQFVLKHGNALIIPAGVGGIITPFHSPTETERQPGSREFVSEEIQLFRCSANQELTLIHQQLY